MSLALSAPPFTMDRFDNYILKLMGLFIDILIKSAAYFYIPAAVLYFGYITNFSILLFLFGFVWICIWKTAWCLLGLAIMAMPFIFHSPKPELIFDTNYMTVGVKDRETKLVIHTDKIPAEFIELIGLDTR